MHTSGKTGDGNRPAIADKPWTAWLTVAATIAIFVLCATLIWYRFETTPETNCVIIIDGDKSLDGSIVEVTPKVAPDPSRSLLKETLQEKNQYSTRFFLNSGTYQVNIQRPDGSTLLDVTDFIPPGKKWTYDVARQRSVAGRPGATQPAFTR